MNLITLPLTALWRRIKARLCLRFDLSRIEVEDDEIELELGFGRD